MPIAVLPAAEPSSSVRDQAGRPLMGRAPQQHDAQDKALRTLRYGCMPHSDIDLLLSAMASDAQALREQCGDPLALVVPEVDSEASEDA